MGITPEIADLAAWLTGLSATLPPEVEVKARLLLLDTYGCALAGMAHPEVSGYAARLAGGGAISAIGFPSGMPPVSFGQALAVAACWDEACEGLARAHGRPGLHSLPAALSVGMSADARLGAVLFAAVAGYEIGGRLGEVWRIRPGMHVDGTWGTISAAVAARMFDEPDADALTSTVEAASCTLPASLYAPVRAGATMRNLYAGQAVSRGIEVASALAAGVTAPASATAEVVGLNFRPDLLGPVAHPGEWIVLQGYLKPFAAVRHVHYGAQAALEWRRRHGGETRGISGLHLVVYPEAYTYCGNRAPETAIQAQFSLTYGLAHALVRGTLGPEAYAQETLGDSEIRRLEALVEVDANGRFDRGRGACLFVERPTGRTEVSVSSVPGDADNPMSLKDVHAKFLAYVGPRIGSDGAAALAGRILEAPIDTPVCELFSV
jgi:2-methylcitrate dehydratase PrpD